MFISSLILNMARLHAAGSLVSLYLDQANESKLLEQVRKKNLERGYWPADVVVRLEQFGKVSGFHGSDARYFFRAVGSYRGLVKVENPGELPYYCRMQVGKGTEGYFSKKELESLGIRLSE